MHGTGSVSYARLLRVDSLGPVIGAGWSLSASCGFCQRLHCHDTPNITLAQRVIMARVNRTHNLLSDYPSQFGYTI
ncbi:MAG: hypothetical protein ACI8PT_004929 [Gammaproteobacteria bacterium]|jgi:hypothetical protein